MTMTTSTTDAEAALAAMRDSRERLAAAANCPPIRHLVFAVILGGLVASQAAAPLLTIAIEAVLVACIGLVALWDRRRTGMFINGYRAGRTRVVTAGLLVFTLAMLVAGKWLKSEDGYAWAPIWCGLGTAVVAYFASRLWQKIYLRELRETP
jgi:uncharacterized protein YbjT (DUF2867 family)